MSPASVGIGGPGRAPVSGAGLGRRCRMRRVAVRGCVEVCRLVHEVVDEFAGVETDRASDLDELDHVEPALAGLHLVDPLLRVVEAAAQRGLGQAGSQAHLSQVAAQPGGYGVEVRTAHGWLSFGRPGASTPSWGTCGVWVMLSACLTASCGLRGPNGGSDPLALGN